MQAAWERFWFQPVSTSTLAVFRMAYGLVLLFWALSLLPDLHSFFSTTGVVARESSVGLRIGLLRFVPATPMVVGLAVVLILAAVCIALGYRTRLATILGFVAVLSLTRRNPWVFNAGDSLLRHLGFFLMLAPAGEALSLDRWRRARDRFWDHPRRAPWALRLVQIQVSVLYLFTLWAKARGTRWAGGLALFDTLRVEDITRVRLPSVLLDSLLVSNVLSYGTLAIELALAVLIWNRRARPWVIGFGVLLHLLIEITLALGFFSLAVFVAYIAFVPEDTMDSWLDRLRRWWASRSSRPPRPGRCATACGI